MALVSNEEIVAGIVAGFKAHGVVFTAKNVDITESAGLRKLLIRLGKAKNVLPGMGYISAQIQLDRVPPGSVQGAFYCIVGAIQVAGSLLRLTMRIVKVETGVVLCTAKADGAANAQGMAAAATKAVRELWTQFKRMP